MGWNGDYEGSIPPSSLKDLCPGLARGELNQEFHRRWKLEVVFGTALDHKTYGHPKAHLRYTWSGTAIFPGKTISNSAEVDLPVSAESVADAKQADCCHFVFVSVAHQTPVVMQQLLKAHGMRSPDPRLRAQYDDPSAVSTSGNGRAIGGPSHPLKAVLLDRRRRYPPPSTRSTASDW